MKCANCEKYINEQDSGCFIVEYLPYGLKNIPVSAYNYTPQFFCPECFIYTAGKEWASKTGYKIEKAPWPNEEQ